MSLLLDSHILLWFDRGDARLPAAIRSRIDRTPRVYVSAATIWELSMKRALGKLPGLQGSISDIVIGNRLDLLPILPTHAEAITELPRLHGDPFDHLLLAQAKVEGLTFVTHDEVLSRYGVPVLLA